MTIHSLFTQCPTCEAMGFEVIDMEPAAPSFVVLPDRYRQQPCSACHGNGYVPATDTVIAAAARAIFDRDGKEIAA